MGKTLQRFALFLYGDSMLVYLKEPMGRTELDGHVVCGEYYNYGRLGPANIPRRVYLKHREVLKEVPITSEWLSKSFNRPFPPVKFTVDEMHKVNWSTLVQIARLMGIEYIGDVRHKSTELQRRALRRGVLKRIEEIRS